MPLEPLTPAQVKTLEKAADTCARCKPYLNKLREMGANVDDEAERLQWLEQALLNALGYQRAVEEGGEG